MKSDSKSENIWQNMGISEPPPLSDGPPPRPVDRSQIEAVIRGEAGSVLKDEVTYLVANYREWMDAYVEILDERSAEGDDSCPDESTQTSPSKKASQLTDLLKRRRLFLILATAACIVVGIGIFWNSGDDRIYIKDGLMVVTLDSGKLEGLEHLSVEAQRAVGRLLRDESFVTPDIVRSRGMVNQVALSLLITPVETVVLSQQPTFRWHAYEDAQSYSVLLSTSADLEDFESHGTNQTIWRPDVPLERGQTYYWRIQIRTTDAEPLYAPKPSDPPARFVVADGKTVEKVKAVQQAKSRLLLLDLYVREGLLDDAERELAALTEQNPDSPTIARLATELAKLRGAPQ